MMGIAKITGLLLLFGLSGFYLLSCATADKAELPEQMAKVIISDTGTAERKAGWQMEWDRSLEEARKEGKLLLYTTIQPEVRKVIAENFEKISGVKVDIITGRGGEIAAKLLGERRAGLYLADVYAGGTTTLVTQLKPAGALTPVMPKLFLPDVIDTSLWYKGVLPFFDKDKLILQTRYTPGGAMMDVAFNPGLIKKEELVSWFDLLNPKLKGKMNMYDPTTAGKGGDLVVKAMKVYGLGLEYLKSLAKQEPVVIRDHRLQIEWVVQLEHIITINPHNEQYEIFKQAGAQLDSTIFKETKDMLGGGSYNFAMIDKPPHPQAARLFANWFLSKEGQSIISRAAGIQSAREDTPTDYLSERLKRKPGVEYAIETEEMILEEDSFYPLAVEIFGPLMK